MSARPAIRHAVAIVAILAAMAACFGQRRAPPTTPSAAASLVVVAPPTPARCDADLATSNLHCGSCDNACPRATRCSAGACVATTPLAAGERHTCLIVSPDEVRCWGANAHGQLGTGPPSPHELAAVVPGLRHVVQIAADGDHTCALDASGDVWCWGAPLIRSLGSPLPDSPTPARVSALDHVKAIAVGFAQACALRDDGTVWCWGTNHEGQLGNGTNVDSDVPVPVALPWEASGIAVGSYTTCAFSSTVGEVACWGMSFDALPKDDRETSFPSRPKVVRKIEGVEQLAVAGDHVCARTATGSVTCWYKQSYFYNQHPAPGQLTAITGIDDAIDLRQSCVLRRTGGVVCLGDSGAAIRQRSSGRLVEVVRADGAAADRVDALAVGGSHVCIRRADGRVACWGANDARQLGDGTPEPRTQPVLVLAPGAPPPSPSDNGAGDACASNADCTWNDPCAPTRCGSQKDARQATTCGGPAPTPGSCLCLEHRCKLHPSSPPPPPTEACTQNDCGLDEGMGRCLVGRGTATNPTSRLVEGPFCFCDAKSSCAFEWVSPAPCHSPDDCWITHGPGPPRAVRRPADIRGTFHPCRDGDVAPACRDGVCAFGLRYGC